MSDEIDAANENARQVRANVEDAKRVIRENKRLVRMIVEMGEKAAVAVFGAVLSIGVQAAIQELED